MTTSIDERRVSDSRANRQMSDRALASLIRYGRQVTLYTPELDDSPSVTGFVTGFDDEGVRLVEIKESAGGTVIEHRMRARSFIAGYDEHPARTVSSMTTGVTRAELERTLKPVRDFVMRKYFTQT